MRLKKIIAALSAAAISVTAMVTVASANNTVDGETGKITWDFAEYTDKTGASGTTTYATEPIEYNGLNIYLANNNANDYVFTDGIHFSGKYAVNEGNSAGRYMSYQPTVNGTLYVTGKAYNDKTNRWGIIDTLGGSFNASYSTNNETESVTVSMPCTANNTYYAYGRDGGVTISKVEFVPDTYVKSEMIGSTSGTDGSVADVFYGTLVKNNADATVSTIDVTVNGQPKPISTTALSGAGDVSFGVVISYADGNNKGYTPTFTFE